MECNSARLSLLECTERLGTLCCNYSRMCWSARSVKEIEYLANLGKRCKPDDEDAASFAKMVRSQVRKMYMYM